MTCNVMRSTMKAQLFVTLVVASHFYIYDYRAYIAYKIHCIALNCQGQIRNFNIEQKELMIQRNDSKSQIDSLTTMLRSSASEQGSAEKDREII